MWSPSACSTTPPTGPPTSELTECGHELAGECLELIVGQRDEMNLFCDVAQDLVDASGE